MRSQSASLDALQSGQRIRALDGLRGVAVLLVIFHHYVGRPIREINPDFLLKLWPAWIQNLADLTWCGVDVFFVLSGFLIGGLLLDHQRSPQLWKAFYARRVCRIFPAYFLLLLLAWTPPIGDAGANPAGVPLGAYVIFLQNLWMGAGVPATAWLAVCWSLAIEEQFYLVAPALITRVSRRTLLIGLSAAIVGAFVLRCLFLFAPTLLPFRFSTYHFTLCRIDGLALGALGAWMVRSQSVRGWLERNRAWLKGAAIGLLAVVVAIAQLRAQSWHEVLVLSAGLTLLALLSLALILFALIDDRGWFARAMRSSVLTEPGKYSYFLYLFHAPVVLVVGRFVPGIAWKLSLSTLLLGALAWLSWRYFEQPLIRIGQRVKYEAPGSVAEVALQPVI